MDPRKSTQIIHAFIIASTYPDIMLLGNKIGRVFINQLLMSSRYYGLLKGFNWTHKLSKKEPEYLFSLLELINSNTIYKNKEDINTYLATEKLRLLGPCKTSLIVTSHTYNATFLTHDPYVMNNLKDVVNTIAPEKLVSLTFDALDSASGL